MKKAMIFLVLMAAIILGSAVFSGQTLAEDRLKPLEKPGTMIQPVPPVDQVREKKGGSYQTPQMVPMDKVQVYKPCPDLAATDISFLITNVWKTPAGRSGASTSLPSEPERWSATLPDQVDDPGSPARDVASGASARARRSQPCSPQASC